MIPRLHVVTDDEVLARPAFPHTAAALARALGDDVAIHLRGHRTSARRLLVLAEDLLQIVAGTASPVLVADRVDVALATPGAGVHLGARSIPVAAARALIGDRLLGCSVHAADEGVAVARDGADFLLLGTIWATDSHPGRKGAGTELIRSTAAKVRLPVVAIGGVTPERAAEAVAAGAAGVAVLRGVWEARDPVTAALSCTAAMDAAAAAAGAGAARS